MPESLSIQQARKLVLLSQRVPPATQVGRAAAVTLGAIEHLGYVQIDTISVIQRAHHHTLWNRNPRYETCQLDQLLVVLADPAAAEAVALGVAHELIRDRSDLSFPNGASLTTTTTVRDLMRSGIPGGSGLALELAAFRFLFATGDPEEGARAFLEKREPSF